MAERFLAYAFAAIAYFAPLAALGAALRHIPLDTPPASALCYAFAFTVLALFVALGLFECTARDDWSAA